MGRASPRAGLCRRLPPTLAALVLDVLAGGHRPRPASKPAKPSALLNTRVIHCGDNQKQLAKLPDACVDLIYIDPPSNSNRNYEVFGGESKEKRVFEARHENTKASMSQRQRPKSWKETSALLNRLLKKACFEKSTIKNIGFFACFLAKKIVFQQHVKEDDWRLAGVGIE